MHTASPLPLLIAFLAFAMSRVALAQCTDVDNDGYFFEAGCGTAQDCNDAAANTHPGAAELCDGFDHDCDGVIDDGATCPRACPGAHRLGEPVILNSEVLSARTSPGKSAWTGSRHLVTWTEAHGQESFQYGLTTVAPVSHDVGEHVEIGETAANTVVSVVRGAWNGSTLGVGWLTSSMVVFGQFDADGSPTAEPLVLGQGAALDLAWNGAEWGIVVSGCAASPLCFYRVTAAGGPSPAPQPIPTVAPSNQAYWPTIIAVGDGWGVTWNEGSTWPDCLGCDRAAFVALSRGGSLRFLPTLVADPAVCQSWIWSLAWNGNEFAVPWEGASCSGPRHAYLSRFSEAGSRVGIAYPLSDPDVNGSFDAQAVWNGSEYGVTWDEQGSGFRGIVFRRFSDSVSPLGERIPIQSESYGGYGIAWTGFSYGLMVEDHSAPDQRAGFIEIGCECTDDDSDGFCIPVDCADGDPASFPNAPEVCDGLDNQCRGNAGYGIVDEGVTNRFYEDVDGDGYGKTSAYVDVCQQPPGYASASGDCVDSDPLLHPGAPEACNALDDDCNGLVDDDTQGLDSDGDGVHNGCDNCRFAYNVGQLDTDGDRFGNSCDNCVFLPNADQVDTDSDARGNGCDNCQLDYNPLQDDTDDDGEGDACDVNDGQVPMVFHGTNYIEWQQEAGFSAWNLYEGDLDVLKGTGVYTQLPGSNPLAERHCGVTVTVVENFDCPPMGKTAFSLVTGVASGIEGNLGQDSRGIERPNTNPCP